MYKFISLAVFSICLSAQAQTYVGLKGGANNTWILNQHIADAGDIIDYKGSYAGSFGLEGIQMLSEQSGVGLYLGLSTIKQQTQGTFLETDYVNQVKLNYTDVALLYKYIAVGGLYLEVGPQMSFRNQTIEEIVDLDGDFEETYNRSDELLADNTVFGVFGIGGLIALNEEFKLNVGLRFGYGFTDLTQELSASEFENLSAGNEDTNVFFGANTDAGISSYTIFAQGEDFDDDAMETTFKYNSTHPAFASFNIGLFYTIK